MIVIFLIGGLSALIGALCYAELGTVLNRTGGDFEYLAEAFGRRLAFVFAWMTFWVVQPASVGATAYIFARYAARLHDSLGAEHFSVLAAFAVACLTAVNAFGLQVGTTTQKLLTAIKVLGILGLVSLGFLSPLVPNVATSSALIPGSANLELAFILVLYTYGGWNVIVLVAAEIKEPHRNLLRALVLGITVITLVYLLAVSAFEHALGHANLGLTHSAAADVARSALGDFGAIFISVLICVTCLANINATVLTNSRIFYAFGQRWPRYRWLGKWHRRYKSPVNALLAQAVIATGLIVALAAGEQSFQRLVVFSAPVFWLFFLLVSISLFVLRQRGYTAPGEFRVPLYPFLPLIFTAICAFMLYASVDYALATLRVEALAVAVVLVAGCIAAFVSNGQRAED
jgi:amino acid transporter